MGKFKVSFTTALFVFSFIICVIVAVAFVDRAPRNNYDAFYESDRAGKDEPRDDERGESDTDDWARRKPADRNNNPEAARPASADEASLADLPIDPHLAGSAQPIAASPPPVAPVNPMAGRSPDDIARAVMGEAGINATVQAATIPGMAVPPGISTPIGAIQPTPASSRQAPAGFLPLQSNIGGAAPTGLGTVPPPAPGYQGATGSAGASGLYATPSLNATSNAENKWSPVQAQPKNPNLLGVRSAPANPQEGMMISDGRSATGAAPPPGFQDMVTQDRAAPPAASAGPASSTAPSTRQNQSGLGGLDQPLLLAPQPESGSNKYDLPPAPTLRPPPVQDPDRRRSEAEPETPEVDLPQSLNPEGLSDQALADSGETPQTADPTSNPVITARVDDKTLTKEQALKLAEVNFLLKDQTLTAEHRKQEVKKAATQWEETAIAAAVAKQNAITVSAPDLERYAALRPDFDPAAWQSAMADKGFSEKEIRENLTEIALAEKLVELEFEKQFSSEKIKEAYEKKPSRYATPRKVHLMEIFKEKPEDEKRAKKLASDMQRLQRQAAGGTDFGLLARQASQAPTRGKGGNLGWITPASDIDEDRDKAISSLKPGQVTEVLEEPAGYRIYKLVDVKEATKDFEGGKDLVVADLKTPLREKLLTDIRQEYEAGTSGDRKFAPAVANASANKEEPAAKAEDKIETAAAAGVVPSEDEAKNAARRDKAQELLAGLAKRRAAEKQMINGAVPQQPGSKDQVSYAPGTQVQQMAGGQPPPVFQAGGQLAIPVQNPLAAAESVSINYPTGNSMQVSGGGQDSVDFPLGSNIPDQQQGDLPSVSMNLSGAQATATGQTPGQQAPGAVATPAPSHSNGWVVSKTAGAANQPPPSDTATSQESANQGSINFPPGFEDSGSGPASASTGIRQQKKSRGVVGSVKSFFGGLRK